MTEDGGEVEAEVLGSGWREDCGVAEVVTLGVDAAEFTPPRATAAASVACKSCRLVNAWARVGRYVCICAYVLMCVRTLLSLARALSHAHTHTHTHHSL